MSQKASKRERHAVGDVVQDAGWPNKRPTNVVPPNCMRQQHANARNQGVFCLFCSNLARNAQQQTVDPKKSMVEKRSHVIVSVIPIIGKAWLSQAA